MLKGEESTADARTWVARSPGLVLGQEEDKDVAGGAMGERHPSIRYDYTNVHAPSGVKEGAP